MNEELQKQMASWLEMLRTGVLDVTNMTKEQMPGLIKEILAWGFWSNFLLFLFFTTITITWAILVFKMRTKWDVDGDLAGPFTVVGAFINILLTLISLIHLIPNFLQVLIAPRLYLISYFTDLLKEIK